MIVTTTANHNGAQKCPKFSLYGGLESLREVSKLSVFYHLPLPRGQIITINSIYSHFIRNRKRRLLHTFSQGLYLRGSTVLFTVRRLFLGFLLPYIFSIDFDNRRNRISASVSHHFSQRLTSQCYVLSTSKSRILCRVSSLVFFPSYSKG